MSINPLRFLQIAGAIALVLLACQKKETAPLYEEVAVERRTIQVSKVANG